VKAISLIGLGFLFFLALLILSPSHSSSDAATVVSLLILLASVGLVGFGSILALPGLVLGLASLKPRGRSRCAGLAGCLVNGLILAVWLYLFAALLVAGANRPGYPRGYGVPVQPYGATDFFSR
jgi:hypothetical protein